ncbi:hypothetical protein Amsp01_089150 [Amycolatopsis sp. NBRC 101858]|nr:hypothetical protein Amsp01_089150 [Amycolatopsis sp. NBRC 101858]
MNWWRRSPEGVVANLRYVLDPGRGVFYDYQSCEYVAFLCDNGRQARRCFAGPPTENAWRDLSRNPEASHGDCRSTSYST